MGFAYPGRTQKDQILFLLNEIQGTELQDLFLSQAGLEGKVESLQGLYKR